MYDVPEVAMLRRLVRAYSSNKPPPILFFGDSCTLFFSWDDADRRRLPELVADDLGLRRSLVAIRGGGYTPALFMAYLRVLSGLSGRPRLIIVPLCGRMRLLPWTEHPFFRFDAAIKTIAQLSHRQWYLIRARKTPVDRRMFDHYERLVYRTRFDEDRTVGDYRSVILAQRDCPTGQEEYVRTLYNYHYGGFIENDPTIFHLTDLRRMLDTLGIPVVAYETPVNHEMGSQLFGIEFRAHTAENFRAMRTAFGPVSETTRLAPTGLICKKTDFVDPLDGTEHLNLAGRLRVAHEIAEQARYFKPFGGAMEQRF